MLGWVTLAGAFYGSVADSFGEARGYGIIGNLSDGTRSGETKACRIGP
jgi:hypothetical protein